MGMVKLNNRHISTDDIKRFELTSPLYTDRRVYIYGYNGFLFWERVSQEEIDNLIKEMNN